MLVIKMTLYFYYYDWVVVLMFVLRSVPELAAHCSPSQPTRPPLRGPRASRAPPSWSSSPRPCTARRCASLRCIPWHLWVLECRWDWRLAVDLLHLTASHLTSPHLNLSHPPCTNSSKRISSTTITPSSSHNLRHLCLCVFSSSPELDTIISCQPQLLWCISGLCIFDLLQWQKQDNKVRRLMLRRARVL